MPRIRITPLADGLPGVQEIVSDLNRIKTHYARLPEIRAAALAILGRVGDNDQAAQVGALARFVRDAVRYLCDPLNAEFIQTPEVLLLQIDAQGFVYGDCDDHALLFATLCEAIGIPCDVIGVKSPGSAQFDHVVAVAGLQDGTLTFDLVAKDFVQPAYLERLYPP